LSNGTFQINTTRRFYGDEMRKWYDIETGQPPHFLLEFFDCLHF